MINYKKLKIKKNKDMKYLPNWWMVYDLEGYCVAYFRVKVHAIEYKKCMWLKIT